MTSASARRDMPISGKEDTTSPLSPPVEGFLGSRSSRPALCSQGWAAWPPVALLCSLVAQRGRLRQGVLGRVGEQALGFVAGSRV